MIDSPLYVLRKDEAAALPVHPVAEAFPIIPDDELLDLAHDLEVNGQVNPIVTYKGQLLDGRNRLAAALLDVCHLDNLTAVEYDGADPVGFILSVNLKRRHLSKGQLAMLALALLPHLEQKARDRMLAGGGAESTGEAAQHAADMVGVGKDSVKKAKALANNAADLADEVKAGTRTLNDAANELARRQGKSPSREANDTRGADDPEQWVVNLERALDDAHGALVRAVEWSDRLAAAGDHDLPHTVQARIAKLVAMVHRTEEGVAK